MRRRHQPFWSRQKPSEEPAIIVNDVTYRSPQKMPEDVRAVWYENVRQLEQREIDWREQKRIVITWSREGNVVRQNISIDGKPQRTKSERWTFSGVAFLSFVICWGALSFYGFGWKEPPLVFSINSAFLNLSFILLYIPWVLLFANAFRKRQREAESRKSRQEDSLAQLGNQSNIFLDPNTPVWKLAGLTLVTLAGTLLVSYYAVFGGVAKVLHYAERKSGEATAVITAKYSYSSKRARCVPRVEFEGFRHVGDELCVDRKFFDLVKVGDSIRIAGTVSQYAIEPERLEIITPTATGKDT